MARSVASHCDAMTRIHGSDVTGTRRGFGNGTWYDRQERAVLAQLAAGRRQWNSDSQPDIPTPGKWLCGLDWHRLYFEAVTGRPLALDRNACATAGVQ